MAYTPASLFCVSNTADTSLWVYRTTDAVGTVAGANYFTDATTTASGKGVPGRGMKIGDMVFVQVVDNVTTPTSITDAGWYYVSAVAAATGFGTVVACGAT